MVWVGSCQGTAAPAVFGRRETGICSAGKTFRPGKTFRSFVNRCGYFYNRSFLSGDRGGRFFAGAGEFAVRQGRSGGRGGFQWGQKRLIDSCGTRKFLGSAIRGVKCGAGKFQAGRMAQRFEASFRWDGMWVALDGRILAGRWELRQNGLAGNWDRERVKKRWLKEISGFGEIRAGGTAQEGLTVFLGGKGDIRQAVFWCRQALNGVLAVCREWSGRTVSAGVTQKSFCRKWRMKRARTERKQNRRGHSWRVECGA